MSRQNIINEIINGSSGTDYKMVIFIKAEQNKQQVTAAKKLMPGYKKLYKNKISLNGMITFKIDPHFTKARYQV